MGENTMDYVTPPDVVESMVKVGAAKGKLAPKDMLIRGALSGAVLGIATTLAFQTQLQFGNAVSGGIIFPGGFVMIVLLGLELVTGNFGVVPLGVLRGKITLQDLGRNWAWVFLGNLLGGLAYAGLFYAATTGGTAITDRIVQVAEAKTIAYQAQGADGMRLVFFKAILCNWMVTMGVVMALTSNSTIGKIAAMWIPLTIFFAQGFEHSVVNMFVIPCGMLFGADVSLSDWWLWNQIPVTLGNIVGGAVFTGMALYFTHGQLGPISIGAGSPAREPSIRTGPLMESPGMAEGS
jgi:formate/nitrite transporter